MLHRALANSMWFNLLTEEKLENLVAPWSDHYPILLDRNPIVRHSFSRRNFHFENAWKLELRFDDMVKESWNMYTNQLVLPKLSWCAEDMYTWSTYNSTNWNLILRNVVGIWIMLVIVILVMLKLECCPLGSAWLDYLHSMIYIGVKEKRHIDIKTGIRKFFHASATTRKNVSTVTSRKDDHGNKMSKVYFW